MHDRVGEFRSRRTVARSALFDRFGECGTAGSPMIRGGKSNCDTSDSSGESGRVVLLSIYSAKYIANPRGAGGALRPRRGREGFRPIHVVGQGMPWSRAQSARYREDIAFTPGIGQGSQARGQSGPPLALRGRGGHQAMIARTRRRGISIGCRAIGRLWG